jgi:hypothetical protein
MNWQAAFDGLLALAAFWVVLGPGRHLPALKLGCLLLGSAAVLGTLRFSGLLPLPQLHQFVSLLGAGVGLPLLAVALVAPAGAVATQPRFTWIFAVIAAVLCVLLGVVAGLKLWGSVCAFAAALTITAVAARRRDLPALGAGICMVLAFATFAAQLSAGPLRPGEFLHIGLALAMLLLGRWATVRHSRESGNPGGMDPRS